MYHLNLAHWRRAYADAAAARELATQHREDILSLKAEQECLHKRVHEEEEKLKVVDLKDSSSAVRGQQILDLLNQQLSALEQYCADRTADADAADQVQCFASME